MQRWILHLLVVKNLHQIAPWYHSFIGDNFQSIVFSINGQKQTFLSQDVWDTPKHSDSVAATNVEEWYQMVIKDPDHGEHQVEKT